MAYTDRRHRCPTCGSIRLIWGKQEILQACRRWAEENGRQPYTRDWNESTPDHPVFGSAVQIFGSWNEMIQQAGFEPVPRGGGHPEWTRDDMIEALFVWVYSHGRMPKIRDWYVPGPDRPSRHQVITQFGSWNAFLTVAGYEPLKSYRTKEGYSAVAGSVTKKRQSVENVERTSSSVENVC